jgi:hypothetical protein
VLTFVACAGLLMLGAWPGLLDEVLGGMFILTFVGMVMVAPVVAVGIALALGVCIWKRRAPFPRVSVRRLPWKHAGAAFGMLLITGVLLSLHIPMRLAFAAAQPQFERYAAQAPLRTTALNQRAGIYRIDEYAGDPRGGVYLRTYRSRIVLLGPDVTSWGFVHRPNEKGSPFGAADYALVRLRGEWYSFRACNDWH